MDFGFWWAERVEASGSGSAVRCPMGPSALSLDHGFAGIGTLGRRHPGQEALTGPCVIHTASQTSSKGLNSHSTGAQV